VDKYGNKMKRPSLSAHYAKWQIMHYSVPDEIMPLIIKMNGGVKKISHVMHFGRFDEIYMN